VLDLFDLATEQIPKQSDIQLPSYSQKCTLKYNFDIAMVVNNFCTLSVIHAFQSSASTWTHSVFSYAN